MNGVMEQFRAAAAEQKAESERSYWYMARRVAAGESGAEPHELLAFLPSVGRTPEQFVRDVELMTRRLALRGQVDEGKAARVSMGGAMGDVRAHEQKVEETKKRHAAELGDLARQRRQVESRTSALSAQIQEGTAAAAELVRCCPYRDLVARYEAARDGVAEVDRALAEVVLHLHHHRQQLQLWERRKELCPPSHGEEYYAKDIGISAGNVRRFEEQERAAAAERDRLAAELNQVAEQMRQP